MRRFIVAAAAALTLALPSTAAAKHGLEFRGQAIVPSGTTFANTIVGGLSSITYDEKRGVYYTVADDPASVRYYTVALDIRDGRLTNGDVRFEKRHDAARSRRSALRADEHRSRRPGADQGSPADLHLRGDREHRRRPVRPPLRPRRPLPGRLPGPAGVPPDRDPGRPAEPRVRERRRDAERPPPLHRDGERARPGRACGDGRHRQPGADPALRPAQRPARPPVDLPDRPGRGAAESHDRVLGQRRRGTAPAQLTVPDRDGALVLGRRARHGEHDQAVPRRARPAGQDVQVADPDLDTLGIPLDNVEGLTFGPRLRDGRQSLVLVSDNNFAATQFTQFLLFGMPALPTGRG